MTSRERKYHIVRKAERALDCFVSSNECKTIMDELIKDEFEGNPFRIHTEIYTQLSTPDNADEMWKDWQNQMYKHTKKMDEGKVMVTSIKPEGLIKTPHPSSPMDIAPPPPKFTKWTVN